MEIRLERLGRLAHRAGLAVVFLWFGGDKFLRPQAWTGLIPTFIFQFLGERSDAFIYGLGTVEVAVGLMFAAGVGVAPAGWLASALLAAIIAGVGLSTTFLQPDVIRDAGLLGAALSLAMTRSGRQGKGRRNP